MYLLRPKEGDTVFYLVNDGEYNVGRKETDILIIGDNSISRKHALVELKNGIITVIDLKAKYNTFLNSAKLDANIRNVVRVNDVIQFGILNSIYTVEEIRTKSVSSSLTVEEKRKLTSNINFLKGTLTSKWSRECTHLTVRDIKLTVKVLCALIEGQPIVTLKYWEDFVSNVKKNRPPPDINDYKPVCAENILNENVRFEYNPLRKTLFKNKVFVFSSNQGNMQMAETITLAGGKCVSWQEHQVSRDEITKSPQKYIFIHTNSVLDNGVIDKSFNDVIDYLRQIGKRSIPHPEIAMAIIMCSCEKDCNPDFDRTRAVLSQKPIDVLSGSILVPETQSQYYSLEQAKPNIVIPSSVEEDFFASPNKAGGPVTSTQVENDVTSTEEMDTICKDATLKRSAETLEKCDNKKIKGKNTEEDAGNMFGFIRAGTKQNRDKGNSKVTDFFKAQPSCSGNSSEDISAIEIGHTTSSKKRKGSEVIGTESITKRQPSTVNPFASLNKSKASNNDNPFKRPSNISYSTAVNDSDSQPKAKQSGSDNPFKRMTTISSTTDSNATKKRLNPFSDTVPAKKSGAGRPVKENTSNNSETDTSSITLQITATDVHKKFSWLSKSDISRDVSTTSGTKEKNTSEVTEAMLNFINSFKDSIVITSLPLILNKPAVTECSNGSTVQSKKNFKKFKKVQPLHMQTTIIPKSQYIRTVCNETQSIECSDDDDQEEGHNAVPIRQFTRTNNFANRSKKVYNF